MICFLSIFHWRGKQLFFWGMPCTKCAHSAKFWMSANTRTLLFAPFDKFLVPYGLFFSFLCIWDVAHLNCHPMLPIFNHFYPFSISHVEPSRLWGPGEGRGDVATFDFSPLWGPREGRAIFDISPLWGPREGRGDVAIFNFSPLWGPQEGRGDVAIPPTSGPPRRQG